jgi:hypothetical protein
MPRQSLPGVVFFGVMGRVDRGISGPIVDKMAAQNP